MWTKGPLPPGTWNWGGVTKIGKEPKDGFYFADFCGDHVKIQSGKGEEILQPEEIGWFCNCLEVPLRPMGNSPAFPGGRL